MILIINNIVQQKQYVGNIWNDILSNIFLLNIAVVLPFNHFFICTSKANLLNPCSQCSQQVMVAIWSRGTMLLFWDHSQTLVRGGGRLMQIKRFANKFQPLETFKTFRAPFYHEKYTSTPIENYVTQVHSPQEDQKILPFFCISVCEWSLSYKKAEIIVRFSTKF